MWENHEENPRPYVGAAVAVLVGTLLLTGCSGPEEQGDSRRSQTPGVSQTPEATSSKASPAGLVMPDLVGLPAVVAGRRLGALELGSSWRSTDVRCGQRPGTIVWQRPSPGTPVHRGVDVQVRTAALDLETFRGPCPAGEGLGPVAGPDTRLARRFYRFAADPSLGAPFASGEVWVGIESGLTSVSLDETERPHLAAWEVGTGYAEAIGPFSALDILASSGGYYEVHRGVAATCPHGNDDPPPQLAGLRAISLTAPADVTLACLDWWAVTLFLASHDRIQGVALRLGSP